MTAYLEAFGYALDPDPPSLQLVAHSAQAMDAKDAETLQPLVVLYMRFDEHDGERVGPPISMVMHPDLADFIADQLHASAARARAHHWE